MNDFWFECFRLHEVILIAFVYCTGSLGERQVSQTACPGSLHVVN